MALIFSSKEKVPQHEENMPGTEYIECVMSGKELMEELE